MTIKFIAEHHRLDGSFQQRSSLEIPESSTLTEAIEAFEQFLKGAGYQFDGYLDIVSLDEDVQPEPEEVVPHWYKNNLEPVMYDEQDVMPMPGTMGGATVTFAEQNEKCKVCGLTSEQLGSHTCYDQRCGLK